MFLSDNSDVRTSQFSDKYFRIDVDSSSIKTRTPSSLQQSNLLSYKIILNYSKD